MPKKELIETGKTVDAAIDSACEKLGCNREDCEWEILDLPKKGFLGLKNTPARVRVAIDIPEAVKPVEKPMRAEPPVPSAPVAKNPPVKPVQLPPETQNQSKPAPQAQPVPYVMNQARKKFRDDRRPSTAPSEEKIALAKSYLGDIIAKMGLEAEIIVNDEDGGMSVNVSGKGLGAIIGRRGETLDAIQYLTSLVVNRSDGEYTRITIDCGDYRIKRKETLEALARKLAAQVKRTNSSRTLEPMNPFERRIIHATVSEIEGVTSISTGEEPMRRVVITTPSARGRGNRGGVRMPRSHSGETFSAASREENASAGERPHRNYDRADRPHYKGRGGRDNRDSGRRPPRQQAQTAPSGPPKKTPEADANNRPLYTKIDLD